MCIEYSNLIKIERLHFFSLVQTETYAHYCDKQLLDKYQSQNINNNSLVALACGLTVLCLIIMKFYDKIYK